MTKSQSTTVNELTRLDKFALVSGIIGLIADAVSLVRVFAFTRVEGGSVTLPVWILIAAAIVYTSFITGIYARRLLVAQNKQYRPALTPTQSFRIERATLVINSMVIGSLFLAYFITIVLLNADHIGGSSTELPFIIAFSSIFVTSVVVVVMHNASLLLYEALDPYYQSKNTINI